MFLTLLSVLLVNNPIAASDINQTDLNTSCLDFTVENGNITVERNEVIFLIKIQCHPSYDLVGPSKMQCIYGKWEPPTIPQCEARCTPPPYIWNGGYQIEGEKTDYGMFKKGTLVTYTCSPHYTLSPPDSKYRVCVKGIWTGANASCVLAGCKPPEPISNGYYVHENVEMAGTFGIGERLHYSCSNGYELVGSPTQTCLEDGMWSPKIPPKCRETVVTCDPPPPVAHALPPIIPGFQFKSALNGTEIEIRCIPKYHNINSPCRAGRLTCIDGEWRGILPICVYSKECPPPPKVRYATGFAINAARFEATKMQKFFVNSQISYQCFPGYEITGNEILTCSSGCWTPADPPICTSIEEAYIESHSGGQIAISLISGTGVLVLLLIICLAIACGRRKPLSRAVSIQPSPLPQPDLADHAALLHHPDRLALIAFADGLQVGQPVLPTYEEATRERGTGYPSSTRLQRPHWPSLVARRSRNSPNPDSIHVTRQGSFASHSASIRSDPMGSTDTMAVSENSTTVTLDTASSHSGSQPASCRAHCGSLASFDTSSVLNTEGVPLLEENELEEVQCGDDISLAMENRSMTDNVSFKLSTASDVA